MITFENVTKIFQDTGTKALDGVSFHIPMRSFWFIRGKSGSGKTTILRLLMKEIEAEQGCIRVNGQELKKLGRNKSPAYRRSLGFVFQDFRLLTDRSVYENVALARRVAGAREADVRRQVTAVLKLVGLEEEYRKFPSQLSGGQQQKVSIARAVVGNPPLLLADEPTGNLDPGSSRELMRLLDVINQRGTTVLVATHDQEAMEGMEFGHPCLWLEDGRYAGRTENS